MLLNFLHLLLIPSLLTTFYVQLGNARRISLPPTLESCNIDKIYQLGDSMSDTGNLIRDIPVGAITACARLPYGKDFHNHPTGRCSNGLLMIDYIALAAGLQLLNPIKDFNANFTNGANFAVAGATALPAHILRDKNIPIDNINRSLDVQLHWMSMHFSSVFHTYKDFSEKLKNALFVIGEIGGDDYYFAYGVGKSIGERKYMVLEVVQAIKNAARRIIQHGGVRLVIPGDFPAGCFPVYLMEYETDDASAYDENHCWKDRNNLAVYHNDHLQQAINELKQEFPNVTIVYADYYNAFLWLLKNAQHLGFDEQSTKKACCGVGGNYNYDPSRECGTPEATVCTDPNVRISWDGIHLTQAAFMIITDWILTTIVPQLQCSTFVSAK